MAKVYSKGAKRRAKKAMPEVAKAPRQKARGRARMAEIAEDAQSTVLTARARRMGRSESEAKDMARQRLSDEAGMAIDILCDPDEATRLWGHYVALTAAEARYHRSMGKSIHAKTAKIEMMQERFETRPDDQVDLRTEDERDRDAVTSWMRWQGYIGRLQSHDQAAIYGAYRRHVDLVDAGQVLLAGRRFVTAMERLDAAM